MNARIIITETRNPFQVPPSARCKTRPIPAATNPDFHSRIENKIIAVNNASPVNFPLGYHTVSSNLKDRLMNGSS